MNSQQVRKLFLDFFSGKGHTIVPSAPIVLKDDPTLMFSNSGMTQFKDYFLGYKIPSHPRIANTQKCLRVSGKHNDLEDVGKDTYHHTMFEMLGNWSFGDYFKKEAIEWAWELLTEVYKIPKEKLFVTVFEGDKDANLPPDEEAKNFWKQFIPEDRILWGSKKDNFWEMGATGPCGPCSEIHIDLRTDEEIAVKPGRELVNKDHPQVIEIWNLVFMQYQRKADGSLEKLPNHHVDTGMGFERLCRALQGKSSNYDTDIFTPIIQKIEELTKTSYGKKEETDIAIRVVADHVRAVAFSIADGQLPSNTGAGYVIRRILRRAIAYAFRSLNTSTPFIYQLVEVLSLQMGEFFPELRHQKELIQKVIREEEQNFLRTIAQGLQRLSAAISSLPESSKTLSGEVVFELYDTYGFPFDLSRLIAAEKGIYINEEEFLVCLEQQKNRSKKASAQSFSDWEIFDETSTGMFIGYHSLECETIITRIREVEQKGEKFYQIVLAETPFYAESGGQIGDNGWLISEQETIEVFDTKKENNLIVHYTRQKPQIPNLRFVAKVDADRRAKIAANHSATHLLHEALRSILGEHVTQKGSFVGDNYLRFDFSHFQKVTEEELKMIEDTVNQAIQEDRKLIVKDQILFAEAIEEGAMALFGEKYGDTVRMVCFGSSKELCGGTHVTSTAIIRNFLITSESAVAAGIRRIEAITGQAVIEHFKAIEEELKQAKSKLKTQEPLPIALEKWLEEKKELEYRLKKLEQLEIQQITSDWRKEIKEIEGLQVLIKKTELAPSKVKEVVMLLRNEHPKTIILVGTIHQDKPGISIGMSDELTKIEGFHAGKWVKELSQHIAGGGGGQAGFASAGGKNINGIEEALKWDTIRSLIPQVKS